MDERAHLEEKHVGNDQTEEPIVCEGPESKERCQSIDFYNLELLRLQKQNTIDYYECIFA